MVRTHASGTPKRGTRCPGHLRNLCGSCASHSRRPRHRHASTIGPAPMHDRSGFRHPVPILRHDNLVLPHGPRASRRGRCCATRRSARLRDCGRTGPRPKCRGRDRRRPLELAANTPIPKSICRGRNHHSDCLALQTIRPHRCSIVLNHRRRVTYRFSPSNVLICRI